MGTRFVVFIAMIAFIAFIARVGGALERALSIEGCVPFVGKRSRSRDLVVRRVRCELAVSSCTRHVVAASSACSRRAKAASAVGVGCWS